MCSVSNIGFVGLHINWTFWDKVHLSSIYTCVSHTTGSIWLDYFQHSVTSSITIFMLFHSECHGINKLSLVTSPKYVIVSLLPFTISFATVYSFWHSLDYVCIIKLSIRCFSIHFIKPIVQTSVKIARNLYVVLFVSMLKLRGEC